MHDRETNQESDEFVRGRSDPWEKSPEDSLPWTLEGKHDSQEDDDSKDDLFPVDDN